MKYIRIEGSTIIPAQPLGEGFDYGAEGGIDLIVSDDAVVRTVDLGREVEGLSSDYAFTNFGRTTVALTKDQRDELDHVFKQIADALDDQEKAALHQKGFPLAPGDDWLDREILSSKKGSVRAEFKERAEQVGKAVDKIEKLVLGIADLFASIRTEDSASAGLDIPLKAMGSKASMIGLTAVDAIGRYAKELSDLTKSVELTYPANHPKMTWRLSLAKAFALAWHTHCGPLDQELFRRIVVAAAAAIERKRAEDVDHLNCKWIDEALAFGEGAPWQAR